MKYLSVKQTAEKWKVSPAMVRRYCSQGRIKGAVMEESGWKIPEKAKKPVSANEPPLKEPELSPLAKKLITQKKKNTITAYMIMFKSTLHIAPAGWRVAD